MVAKGKTVGLPVIHLALYMERLPYNLQVFMVGTAVLVVMRKMLEIPVAVVVAALVVKVSMVLVMIITLLGAAVAVAVSW